MKQTHEHLSDILLFVEVARCASFRRAAGRLEMPVATLSRRIARLEKRLGVQLLVRTTRSVALAQAAQLYFERCVRVIEAAEAAQSALAPQSFTQECIRVSMPVDLGAGLLGPIMAAHLRESPGLRLEMDLSTQTKDLFRDPVDLVFRIGRPVDERVVARKIWEIEAGIYAAPSCVRRVGELSSLAEAVDLPCLELMTASGPMPWKVAGSRSDRAPGQVRMSANNMGLLLSLALQGHGAAILPKYLAAEFVRSGQLTELFPSSKVSAWPLYVLTASRSLSQQMRKLIAHVQSQLAQIQR